MSKARYIMIGGFLGAGKTTAILQAAEYLSSQQLRVGLITNDQSYGLVDTKMLAAHRFPVEEITGGCFCCNFNSLVEASRCLSSAALPDVFLAEPVGSCTDLKATVDYPLRRMYGDDYLIAPLSVVVDPIRALRILGLETGKSFSQKVMYIYGKQLEEAELIVINKIDLLADDRLQRLREALASQFPRAQIHTVSARQGLGMERWIQSLTSSQPITSGTMEVDYDIYAEGESLLGWVNGTWQVSADEPWDGNALVLRFAQALQTELAEQEVEVAHLKMVLAPHEGNDLAVVNLVRSDVAPEASHLLQEPLEGGELTLNLRAEGDPENLRSLVLRSIDQVAGADRLEFALGHLESFRPGRPTPTHRMTAI